VVGDGHGPGGEVGDAFAPLGMVSRPRVNPAAATWAPRASQSPAGASPPSRGGPAGRPVGVPYGSNPATCPVRAWEAWTTTAGITTGPLFRPITRHGRLGPGRLTAASANRAIQRAVARAGYDPRPYSAHSLRAGLATSAAEAGVSARAIMNQTGHRSLTVARSYIRAGSLFRDNAAAQIGL
jgi:integrase-like protein